VCYGILMGGAGGTADFFRRVANAAKTVAAWLGAAKRPAMVGTPPSERMLGAIPADPADHAEEFAHTWVDRLEVYVEERMRALGHSCGPERSQR
jgi:hypothetical protein